MASKRETAIAALCALLQQTGAVVWRDTDLARDVEPESLIKVSEFDSASQAIMSPLRWEIDQACEVEVTVTAADEYQRDAVLDAVLVQIGALIAGDRQLGGAVDWTEPSAPTFDAMEIDGAGKTARLIVTLSFVTAETILA